MTEDIPDGRNLRTAEDSWEYAPTFEKGSNLRELVGALLSQADTIDNSLDEIRDGHHINTATGEELELIGEFVGVARESNESDTRYRTRIKTRFRAGTIEPTTDNFTEFVFSLLGVTSQEITLNTSDVAPRVTISTLPEVWERNDLTTDTLASLLQRAVPAGHAVSLQTEGTFLLKGDGDIDDPPAGLTGDNSTEGGTLAGDVGSNLNYFIDVESGETYTVLEGTTADEESPFTIQGRVENSGNLIVTE